MPIFQEQVIKLAMVAAGFSAGEADQLRRAMAAWKSHGDLTPFREKLVTGMLERGHDADFAERLYQQICGFGGYGFPESLGRASTTRARSPASTRSPAG